MKDLLSASRECMLCDEHTLFHSSINESVREGPKGLSQIVKDTLNKKYLTSREYYNVKIINDIIYNEATHVVSVFKDYLIFDDVSEFMKRIYSQEEAVARLPRMFDFYEKYSKVFPNYIALPE